MENGGGRALTYTVSTSYNVSMLAAFRGGAVCPGRGICRLLLKNVGLLRQPQERNGIIPAPVDWMVYVSRVNHRN